MNDEKPLHIIHESYAHYEERVKETENVEIKNKLFWIGVIIVLIIAFIGAVQTFVLTGHF